MHNVIVCTLCSCYPKMLLGIPPAWYKSLAYRSRAVTDPRGVLEEFGVEVPSTTDVRVHDSTADLRYIVLPMRPKATRGWSEEELAAIVTRDCMIGTALPRSLRSARSGLRIAIPSGPDVCVSDAFCSTLCCLVSNWSLGVFESADEVRLVVAACERLGAHQGEAGMDKGLEALIAAAKKKPMSALIGRSGASICFGDLPEEYCRPRRRR